MTTTDKLFIVEAENRVVRVEELWVEDDLDPVRGSVKELDTSDLTEDWIVGVVGHVVGRDWRERVSLEGEHSSL